MRVKGHRSPERRKHPRVKFQEPVEVHEIEESKSGNIFEVRRNPIILKGLDVSEGGIRLEFRKSPPLSTFLKLSFRIPQKETVDVYSRLGWMDDGHCGLGFILLDGDARKRIKTYLNRVSAK